MQEILGDLLCYKPTENKKFYIKQLFLYNLLNPVSTDVLEEVLKRERE